MKRIPFALGLFAAGTAFAQCEAPAPVSKLLAGPAFGRKVVESQEDVDARAAAFRDARAQYADNYFILRRELQVSYFNQPEERLRVAREWHAGHPGSPMFELLEAFALEGRDTPQAIRRMEALEAGHPEMERVPLELGSLFGSGRFKDKNRAAKELTAYWKLCPESIDGAFLSHVSDNGSPEQVARAAVIVRKRLAGAAGDPVPGQWEDLWRLEFKAHPLAEHAAVRKQIAADLARFEKSPRRHEVEWEIFLRNGYESMGDQAAVERMSDEIVEQHPDSVEARRTVEERWRKQNAPGPATDPAEAEARARASLAANREWHKRWPEDADILHTIFNDLARLPETTPEQFAAAVDEFQAAYRKKADFFTTPPIEFRIAQGYIKYKIRLDQVPAMVETGYQDAVRRNAMNLNDDRNDDTARGMFQNSLDSMRINSTGILLDYYILARQPEKVKQAMARVDSVDTSKPFARAGMAELRAKAAEAEGRKADALLLYRAAIDARQGTFTPPNAKDELADGMARMWKDLGGTAEGFALLSAKPKPTEATDNRWERPQNPLPAFALPDLNGKTWKLASLEGKTLLVNIWASWCGPCKAEHPEFQKLYDKLKDRPDVTVLSFNVDEDLGKVAPYVAENHLTFPVIPAKDVVDAVVPSLAIPRNWLVDSKGRLEWEQIGFGADPAWQEHMLAKLEEVVRGEK